MARMVNKLLIIISLLLLGRVAYASANVVTVTPSNDKIQLFNSLEYVQTAHPNMSAASIAKLIEVYSDELQFVPKADGIHVMSSTDISWFRVKLSNPTSETIDTVLYNHFNFYEMDVRVVQNRRTIHQGYLGYGTPSLQDLGWFFPAHRINIPPGEVELFLGLNTNRHPAGLNFELLPIDPFNEFTLKYIVFVTFFLSTGLAIGIFNVFLFAGLRSKLHVYYVLGVFGLITIEACITGGLALLGPVAQAMAGPLWIFALGLTVSGCLMFMRTYFDINKANHPYLNRFILSSVAFMILTFLAYGVMWQYAMPLIFFGIGLMVLLLLLTLATKFKSDPAHALMLSAILAPVFTAGTLYTYDLIYSIDSTRSNIFFCGAGMFAILGFSLVSALHMARVDRNNRVVASALGAVMPALQVKKVIENRIKLNHAPEIHYVTVMFVDIVGYSLAAKRHLPIETFNQLRDLLRLIGKVVHHHGGIIDKSLGDGCLCFFGYDLGGSKAKGHEQTAVLCALDIQRKVVAEINQMSVSKKVVFPLRIGINSAEVCIGNIGDENRFDFTLTGDGVNLASRFETACEPFKVMIGKTTYEALDIQTKTLEKFFQRLIPVKHSMPLVETYEVNPFDRDPKAIDEARSRYWKSIDEQPRDQRYTSDSDIFTFHTNHGIMVLQNFSLNGSCFRSTRFLGKGVEIAVDISQIVDDPEVRVLSPINVQVVWGVPIKNEYFMLGTRIQGLNGRQREIIVEALKQHLAKTKGDDAA